MDRTGNYKTGISKCIHEFEYYSYVFKGDIYKCIYCNKSKLVEVDIEDAYELQDKFLISNIERNKSC